MLSVHYHLCNSFFFVNDIKDYKLKTKDSEIKPYPLCLGDIAKDF